MQSRRGHPLKGPSSNLFDRVTKATTLARGVTILEGISVEVTITLSSVKKGTISFEGISGDCIFSNDTFRRGSHFVEGSSGVEY